MRLSALTKTEGSVIMCVPRSPAVEHCRVAPLKVMHSFQDWRPIEENKQTPVSVGCPFTWVLKRCGRQEEVLYKVNLLIIYDALLLSPENLEAKNLEVGDPRFNRSNRRELPERICVSWEEQMDETKAVIVTGFNGSRVSGLEAQTLQLTCAL